MALINLSRDELACMDSAFDHYGNMHQIMLAVEEMSELQKELIKFYRREHDYRNIVEELADVIFMMRQVQEMLSIPDEDLIDVIQMKCRRTNRRIEDEKKAAKKVEEERKVNTIGFESMR